MVDLQPTPKRVQRALIDRFYDDMWNRFDTSIFPDILHPEITFRGSLGRVTTGFAAFRAYVEFIESFAPDFHNEIITTIIEDNLQTDPPAFYGEENYNPNFGN